MKYFIACDHAAIDMKLEVYNHLKESGVDITDLGPYDTASVDYPDYARKVCEEVLSSDDKRGILICGTGVGISIAANKHKGIRAAVCSEPFTAKLSKQHNNSNVLCFGARVVGFGMAKLIVDEWMEASFEGDRHQKRLDKITDIENDN